VQTEVKEIIDRFKIDLGTSIDFITFGNVLNKLNRAKEAETYCKILLKIHLTLKKDITQIWDYLGNAYFLQGNYQLALKHYQEAGDILPDVRTTEPKNETQNDQGTLLHPTLNLNLLTRSQIYNNIGCIYQRLGNHERALEFLKKSSNAARDDNCQSSDLAKSYNNIASVYVDIGDYDSALKNYREALDIALRTLPTRHPSITQYLDNIASLERRTSRSDDVTSAAKRFQNLTTNNDQSDVSLTTKDFQPSRTPSDQAYDSLS
jgi:tetratricopeptide (TPR) repeat protein